MKILVLNGSPKRENSDCMHMTSAFLEGMSRTADTQVHIVHVTEMHIEYCRGCLSCMRNGGDCQLKDDMRGILEEILDSDLLLFSFPLYCYGMPAPLKALIDRTLPLSSMAMQVVNGRYEHVSQRDFSRLKYVMISGCGFPSEQNNFEAMTAQFRLMFGEDAAVIAVPESPMFNAEEARPVTEPFLAKMRGAGEEYARTGALSTDTLRALSVPMIPPEIYEKIVNGQARA